MLKEQQNARREREAQRIRMMNADPFDLEAQRLIAKEIEQKNIDQNMELAMEARYDVLMMFPTFYIYLHFSPESFGSVIMLYINCTVNGHQVKAFVDSGAQATIMSQVKHTAVEIVLDFDIFFKINFRKQLRDVT